MQACWYTEFLQFKELHRWRLVSIKEAVRVQSCTFAGIQKYLIQRGYIGADLLVYKDISFREAAHVHT